MEGRNHTHVSSETSYGLIHPAIWSWEREGREVSKKKSKKTGHMVGQSTEPKGSGRGWEGEKEGREVGLMDAVSLPPSFLPHRSPQQVCSPSPSLSLPKAKAATAKGILFPAAAGLSYGKAIPRVYARTCCWRGGVASKWRDRMGYLLSNLPALTAMEEGE